MEEKAALLLKLESVQKVLPSIIERLKKGESISPEKIVGALQTIGGEVFNMLSRDFQVFHIGRKGELRVISEWAYQADRAEEVCTSSRH